MKWIMALNAPHPTDQRLHTRGLHYQTMALVALQSARLYAPELQRFIVFNGEPCEFTERARCLGAEVIYHRLSFQDHIDASAMDDEWKQIARGAMLRLDLPLIFDTDEVVFYTDTDVMFIRPPVFDVDSVSFFACAPEFDINDYRNFNTGSMLLHLGQARREFAHLVKWVLLNIGKFPDFDQGALRIFYGGKCDKLSKALNWKPYWGYSSYAALVHFHGPKPFNFSSYTGFTIQEDSAPIYKFLHGRAPLSYTEFLKRWFSFANSLQSTLSTAIIV